LRILARNALTGEPLPEVVLQPSDVVLLLRQAVEAMAELPRAQLLFNGRQLSDSKTLESVGVRDRSEVLFLATRSARAAGACGDGAIRVWDAKSGGCEWEGRGGEEEEDAPEGPALAVAISEDGNAVVASSRSGLVKVWDVGTGECLHTLRATRRRPQERDVDLELEGVCSVAFSPDMHAVGTMFVDKVDYVWELRIWDVESGHCKRTCQGRLRRLCAAAASPDGRAMAAATLDGDVCLWAPGAMAGRAEEQAEPDVRIRAFSLPASSLAYSPDGGAVLCAAVDGMAKVLEASSGECLRTLQFFEPKRGRGPLQQHVAASFSSDGLAAVACGSRSGAQLWDLVSGDCRHALLWPEEDDASSSDEEWGTMRARFPAGSVSFRKVPAALGVR